MEQRWRDKTRDGSHVICLSLFGREFAVTDEPADNPLDMQGEE